MAPKTDKPETMTITEMQEHFNMSLAEICRVSHVPYKTLQRWKQNGTATYELFLLEEYLDKISKTP